MAWRRPAVAGKNLGRLRRAAEHEYALRASLTRRAADRPRLRTQRRMALVLEDRGTPRDRRLAGH